MDVDSEDVLLSGGEEAGGGGAEADLTGLDVDQLLRVHILIRHHHNVV